MRRIGVTAAGERSSVEVVAWSSGALDRPLVADAELWVALARDAALLAGAFQRGRGLDAKWPLLRRGSGGPEVLVGPGTLHVALSMAHPGALFDADTKRIVNRAVRPLLRGLTRSGCPARFFGRDWVSVGHRPVAWVGFAHDSRSRRTLFEAFVAVRTDFAVSQRASFLGKPHGTLEGVVGRSLDPLQVAGAIVDAYCDGHDARSMSEGTTGPAPAGRELLADPPWTATVDEAIGTIGAGPDASGAFRVGGDLLVSRDALARLEAKLQVAGRDTADAEIGAMVDAALGGPEVALDGIRSLESVRDVVVRALRSSQGP